MQATNPKDDAAAAEERAPLDYLEPAADAEIARALKSGAAKYGYRNFTIAPIKLRTYVAAIRRHTADLLSGEDFDKDSGLHHAAHIGANVHCILAALNAGVLIDDRAPEVIDRDTRKVAPMTYAFDHFHTPPGFMPCTRDWPHDGPCALPECFTDGTFGGRAH
jgi:hypothetical protein